LDKTGIFSCADPICIRIVCRDVVLETKFLILRCLWQK